MESGAYHAYEAELKLGPTGDRLPPTIGKVALSRDLVRVASRLSLSLALR